MRCSKKERVGWGIGVPPPLLRLICEARLESTFVSGSLSLLNGFGLDAAGLIFVFNAGSIILGDLVGDAVGFLFLRVFLSR
jgi:hypothetical protein